ELGGLALDDDPERAATALGRAAPRFASPVILAPDRSLLFPPAPPAQHTPRGPDAALDLSHCRALAEAVSTPRAQAKAADARRELLHGCPDLRSRSGRFLWPVIALDPTSRSDVDDGAVAGWIEAHAAQLSELEREATRADAERVLSGEARDRAMR